MAKFGEEGLRTAQPAQALLVADGELVPLATSGDVMPGSGERLVEIPDGIGSWGGKRYRWRVRFQRLTFAGVFEGAEGAGPRGPAPSSFH